MRRPNILVFLTDDHGQWASSAYGNSEIHSPTMQFLADTGTRFANATTPSPVCSPARASFFTGKMPSAHGVHDFLRESGDERTEHPGILAQTNLGMYLQGAGYTTALCGKWHCGNFWKKHPGFDVWFTSAYGTNARFGEQVFMEDDARVVHHGHQAPFYTDRALRFLKERDTEKPFFLFVGYTDTHTPHTGAPERLVAKYRNASFSDIPEQHFFDAHGVARMHEPKDDARRRAQRTQYYAAVSMIDEQMGRIVDELDSQGLLEDTLIVYTSDHGHMNGHHGLHTKGNATVPQNVIEESIRVPCLLRWPGLVRPGAVREELVNHCDLFATLLDVAGVDAGGCDHRPGESYLPLLRGEGVAWRDATFTEYGNARMVRTRTHKLIQRWPGPNGHFGDELYDLSADPDEERNVIDSPNSADLRRELYTRIENFFARYEDPEHSGLRVMDGPRCNPCYPWELNPADFA